MTYGSRCSRSLLRDGIITLRAHCAITMCCFWIAFDWCTSKTSGKCVTIGNFEDEKKLLMIYQSNSLHFKGYKFVLRGRKNSLLMKVFALWKLHNWFFLNIGLIHILLFFFEISDWRIDFLHYKINCFDWFNELLINIDV